MKFKILATFVLACFSSNIFAEEVLEQADVVCVEESGFSTNYFIKGQKSYQFDENGELVGTQAELVFQIKMQETFPETYSYSVLVGENEIANFRFIGKNRNGSGEMVDSDQKLECFKIKK